MGRKIVWRRSDDGDTEIFLAKISKHLFRLSFPSLFYCGFSNHCDINIKITAGRGALAEGGNAPFVNFQFEINPVRLFVFLRKDG